MLRAQVDAATAILAEVVAHDGDQLKARTMLVRARGMSREGARTRLYTALRNGACHSLNVHVVYPASYPELGLEDSTIPGPTKRWVP